MGTSRSAAELAGKLQRFTQDIENSSAEGVEKGALAVKNVTLSLITQAAGGDLVLSGVGKNGAKLGVRYDIKGTKNPTALVRALGPAQLIERDTEPHIVASRYGPTKRVKAIRRSRFDRKGRERAVFGYDYGRVDKFRADLMEGKTRNAGWQRRAVVSFMSGGEKVTVRYVVKTGGSKGRKPYERGFTRAQKIAPREYARVQRQAFQVFR